MTLSLPERITCSACGKSVSTPVPAGTLVRAWVQCPECVEAEEVSEEQCWDCTVLGGTCPDCSAARAEGFRLGLEAAAAEFEARFVPRGHDASDDISDCICHERERACAAAIRALPLPEVPRA